jgi:agmatinase
MKISLLGVKWDKFQCFRTGAGKGVDLIRREFVSDTAELNIFCAGESCNLYDTEVQDLGDVEPENEGEMITEVGEKLSNVKGLPVVLGGSHAISYPVVKSLKPENFLVIDAHSDLYPKDFHEDSWMKHGKGELSQENVTWCVRKEGVKVHMFGQRIFAPEEEEFMKANNLKVSKLEDLKKIKGSVYLSVDFDCFKPSIFPAVGNPEIGGLDVEEFMEAVRQVADKIVAVDFVEFTPFPEDETGKELNKIYARLASKIIWGVLAEIKRARKK